MLKDNGIKFSSDYSSYCSFINSNLWRVDDGGRQILMNNFYQWLETGKVTKAEALRQAQISLIHGKYNPQQLAALAIQKSPEND
ncbi:CHAT domain-containing protein [Okeania sp. SIO3I5]|uniref:CHAT domain-containing protein n=1 Tax=Okeania sp. SIO3I5 TaxID=2607805 RepID=UPI0025EC5C91|nr:CHAT domain-containing protein [Okeania sp. SIO3I5]